MIRLFVAEKPSVARDLAKVLGAHRRGPNRLEGEGIWVAWCLGHLVEPAMPDAHDPRWKSWDAALLPIMPRQLKLIASKRTASHFKALKASLIDPRVSAVVNACDAGREGELIFRLVYEKAGCKAPVERFWVSSLTPTAIRAGLSSLRPSAQFDGLGAAARCRAEADWLIGMNATRALTAVGGTLLSVGRVQTPTLAMIVERDEAIEDFVPEPYFEVHAQLEAPNAEGEAHRWRTRWIGAVGQALPKRGKDDPPPGRLGQRTDAEAIAASLQGQTGVVAKADRVRQRVPPPQLHHLTSLQQEANRRFGMTADQTLKAAQALYERHKLLTYPRTDSRHLTTDVAAQLPGVLRALDVDPYAPFVRPLLSAGLPKLSRRYVDDSKVGDHHGLIPTDKPPNLAALGQNERRVYDLVARRLIAAHMPDAVYAKTRLEAHVAGQRLESSGRVRMEAGWEAVEPPQAQRRHTGQPAELPRVERGDAAHVDGVEVQQKETRPPKRFTEATVLGAMERAGRDLEEAELRAAMREGGLGTPATRASIIETLLRRGYLGRQGKLLVSEPPGRALIGALPVPELKSPRLTGVWEARLKAIAEDRAPAMGFRRDIRQFTREIVALLASAPRVHVPEAQTRGGFGRKKRRGKGTRSARGARAARTPAKARAKRSAKSAPARQDGALAEAARQAAQAAMRSKTSVDPVAQPTARERVAKPKKSAPKKSARCPKCQEGQIIGGQRGWGCSRWRDGCRFVVWFEIDGVAVPADEADRLFRKGQTRLFAERPGFKRSRLVLDLNAEGNTCWEQTKRGR